MKCIQGLFQDLKNTFYNPAFYKTGPEKTLGTAIGLLFFTCLLSAIIFVAYTLSGIRPAVAHFSKSDFVEKNYPDGLVFSIVNGEATTTATLPYLVPVQEESKKDLKEYDNILAIDTRPDVSLETLQSYKASVTITKDRAFLTSDSQQRIIPFKGMEDFTIDKAAVQAFFDMAVKIFSVFVIPVSLLAIPVVALFSLGFSLAASLLGALIVLLIAQFRKMQISYGQGYKIALYASVPGIVIGTIAMLLGISVLPFPVELLLFILIAVLNTAPKPETPAIVQN